MAQTVSETINTGIGSSATKFGYAEFDISVFGVRILRTQDADTTMEATKTEEMREA